MLFENIWPDQVIVKTFFMGVAAGFSQFPAIVYNFRIIFYNLVTILKLLFFH